MKLIPLLLVGFISFSVQADSSTDWSKLTDKKKTDLGLYMTPEQAYTFMKKNEGKALFLDVRSRPEVNFLGMATVVTANVPFI